MKQLQIDSVLCHAALSLELSPGVTFVTGKNTSGKTSLARILAALTTHDSNPAHVSAANAKVYVQDGSLEGQARLDDVVWRPPGGVSAPPGQEPEALPHAVGLVDFVRGNRAAKERAKLWEGLFLPDDPMAILRPRWSLPESQLSVVVDVIKERGWEAASAIYEQRRTEAKRRWEHITGDGRYGSRKASSWVPKNWRTELEGAAETDLQAAAVDLRDQIQALSTQQTIEQSKIDEAKKVLAEDIPALQQEMAALDIAFNKAKEEHQEKGKRLDEVNGLMSRRHGEIVQLRAFMEAKAPHVCPHCKMGLKLEGGTVAAWVEPTTDDIQKAMAEKAAAEAQFKELEESLPVLSQTHSNLGNQALDLQRTYSEMSGRMKELQKRAELANMQPSKADDALRAKLEAELSEANLSLTAFKAWQDARREHDNIIELDSVCHLLGATGARGEHMRQAMDKVRQVMTNACTVSGWAPISILDDYGITSGGRPIPLCAHNEQMKAQWVCQVAAAMLAGGDWLVLDQADLLRDESWTGLIDLLNRLAARRPGLHIVVCATSSACPDGWWHIRLTGE